MESKMISSVPWNALEHAHGSAQNAPQAFDDLLGLDEDARDDAVNEFLLSSAYHQSTTYSCTPYVVRCVLHIIENEDISNLETIGAPLIRELLGFIKACTHSAKTDSKLRAEILDGLNCYKSHLEYPDSKTAKISQELVGFCDVCKTENS